MFYLLKSKFVSDGTNTVEKVVHPEVGNYIYLGSLDKYSDTI